jgi:hypothetical protein
MLDCDVDHAIPIFVLGNLGPPNATGTSGDPRNATVYAQPNTKVDSANAKTKSRKLIEDTPFTNIDV